MNQNEAIPSARLKMFLVPQGANAGDTLALGLVEDVSAQNDLDAENFKCIGEPIPPGNVVNSEQGRVRFTKVFQINQRQRDIYAPRVSQFTQYESFDLLALDPKDNTPVFLAVGVLPSSLSIQARAGSSPREQYDAICRVVLIGDEITQAMEQAA